MAFHSKEISDEELKSLTTVLHDKLGLDFSNYETKSLKRGFARLIIKHKFGSVLGLWSKILKDKDFILSIIDDLTVNLTELFRNPEIWEGIKNDILPQFTSKIAVNIWHAGCSTGEEVYTMAIVLSEKHMLYKTKALATDLSSSALGKAIEGKYPNILITKYSDTFDKYLNDSSISLKDKYFDQEDTVWKVKDKLRKHINFKQHNLVHDPMLKKFDILFCRNVMIYFDTSLKLKVLELFYNCLNDGGFLIIGYYDMLPETHKTMFEVYDHKLRIYKKIPNGK